MKLRIAIISILSYMGIISAYAQEEKELKVEEDGYKWYLVSSDSGKGAQSESGIVIVPLSKGYEWVNYDNGIFCGSIFSPDGDYNKTRNGYYSKAGKEIIPYTKYESAYYQYEEDGKPSWFSVKKGGNEGACDITGKEVVPPIYKGLLYGSKGFEGKKEENGNYESLNILLPGHDIMAFVEKKQKTESDGFIWYELRDYPNYGAADKNGNILFPMNRQLTKIKYHPSTTAGKFGVFEVFKDDIVGVYNSQGIEILSPDKGYTYWKYIGNSENGYIRVDKGPLEYGFCDLNQNEIIAPGKYSYVSYNTNGFFEVKQGDYEGICDLNGTELIAPNKYTSISHINFENEPHWFSVKKDEKEGAYDMSGKELVPALYGDLYYDNEVGFYYENNGNDIALNVKITTNNTNSENVKALFDLAYNTPDSETQTKYDLYMQVIEADTDNKEGFQVIAYNNIGALYEYLGDLKTARAYYEKCLQISPSYELAGKNLKRVKRQQNASKWSNALGQVANALGGINDALQTGNSYNNSTTNSGNSYNNGTQQRTKAAKPCTHCAGTGECKTCRGNGRILGKIDQEWRPCPTCNYGGSASKEKKGKCTFCNGTGTR